MGVQHLIPEGFVGATPEGTQVYTGRRKEKKGLNCEWGGKFAVLERCARS